jgi:hypothetical protein
MGTMRPASRPVGSGVASAGRLLSTVWGDGTDQGSDQCDVTDPSLLAGLLKVLGEVRALECRGVRAFPDVGIAFWINFLIETPLFIENVRKPRIVPPIGFDDDSIVWLLGPEEVIDGVALAPWIPIRPEL